MRTTQLVIGVIIKFLLVFVPTCAVGAGGLWVALKKSGFVSVIGWIITILFAIAALLELFALINGFIATRRMIRVGKEFIKDISVTK